MTKIYLKKTKEEIKQEADRKFKAFSLTSVCREDLENEGYDTSKVSDSTMEELASKMGEAIMPEFWQDLHIIADDLKIKRRK